MNSPTWNIVKKDFQHLWYFLAVWWSLLVIEAVYTVHGLNRLFVMPITSPYAINDAAYTMTERMLPLYAADLVILFFVVIETIKSDPPTDERAEWRTRPVGRRRLFLAKLLFIGIACFLVPGAIGTITRLYIGFGRYNCLIGFVQFALIQSAGVAVAALATLLFRRVVIGLMTFSALGAIGYVLWNWLAQLLNYRFELNYAYDWGYASNWIYVVLPLASALVVVALIYAGARRRLGWLIVILCLVATGPLTIWGTYLYRDKFIYVRTNGPTTNEVKMDLVLSKHFEKNPNPQESPDPANPDDWLTYAHVVNFDRSAFRGKIFNARIINSQLQWPGEKKNYVAVEGGISIEQNYADVVAAAGYGRLAVNMPESITDFGFISLSKAELARAQREPARWTGYVNFWTYRVERVLEVPLTGGAGWQPGTYSRIESGFGPNEHHEVTIRLEIAAPFCLPALNNSNWQSFRSIYLLYNPKTNESVSGGITHDVGSGPLGSFYFTNTDLSFEFAHNTDVVGQHLSYSSNEEIKKWLADAHLVELRQVADREFISPVTIDPFLMPKDASPDAPLLSSTP